MTGPGVGIDTMKVLGIFLSHKGSKYRLDLMSLPKRKFCISELSQRERVYLHAMAQEAFIAHGNPGLNADMEIILEEESVTKDEVCTRTTVLSRFQLTSQLTIKPE